MDFAAVLDKVSKYMKKEGEPFALVGGLGLAALGIPRATLDLDLLVPAKVQESLIRMMEEQGYETLYRSSGYSNHLHADPLLGRVDFIYVRGETQTSIFSEATRLEGPSGTKLLVPRPEHLVAMKVHAMKNDPSRRLQDLADISKLVEMRLVDREQTRLTFEKHGMLESWNELAPPDTDSY